MSVALPQCLFQLTTAIDFHVPWNGSSLVVRVHRLPGSCEAQRGNQTGDGAVATEARREAPPRGLAASEAARLVAPRLREFPSRTNAERGSSQNKPGLLRWGHAEMFIATQTMQKQLLQRCSVYVTL